MPEGPEIRLAADRIGAALERRVVERVWFAFPGLKKFKRQIEGSTVRQVETRGKAILVRFDNALNLYSHNQLYGRWYVTPADERPDTGRQLRVALHTGEHSALLYSASEIQVLKDDELEIHRYLARLGPDVLDRSVKPVAVRRRMRDERFLCRSLGGLLLDQGFFGGIGNYLRSEILFVSRMAPTARPEDLSKDQIGRFSRAVLAVSRRAYRTRGITNDADTVRTLRDKGFSREEYRHLVFDREGQVCYRCGEEIQRRQVAGRRLYVCPHCQRWPAKAESPS